MNYGLTVNGTVVTRYCGIQADSREVLAAAIQDSASGQPVAPDRDIGLRVECPHGTVAVYATVADLPQDSVRAECGCWLVHYRPFENA